jgi:transcriptional regulator with XRE-family HTH domain
MKRKKTPQTLTDQLRERIHHWTEQHGCSLYELATAAGVSRSIVCRFVAGDRNINLATVDRLAAVLKLRLVEDR